MSGAKKKSGKERWERETRGPWLEEGGERRPRFSSTSGYDVESLYTPADIEELNYDESLGEPGEYPFTRGVYETMYRGRLWTMRQYSGFGTAKTSNERYRYLLSRGTTGLSLAFDLPTQMGYDSDHPSSKGEVGRVGVAIDTIDDMETAFDGIPLDKVSTSMTINSTASILLAMYIAVAEKQGISAGQIRGTIQNDVLKEYIARGTYIYPPRESMRIITDVFAFCSENVPKWNTISVSGYHIREAGSTAVQEVAFTLANGIAYVQAALDAGLDVDSFAPRVAFFFNVHNDFLEEIAKFRCARRLWARIMRERFGAKKPASWMLRFHAQTGGSTLTAQQPDNNVVRVTTQALAAVLGGAQSIHTNSKDEALALPTEETVTLALRTQQIIAYESGVANTADPLGGSYAIEALTDRLEREARDLMGRIEKMGGAVEAIEQGYPQREIQDSAYRYQQEIESKGRLVVGLNAYRAESEKTEPTLRLDPRNERDQIGWLSRFKAERDSGAVEDALAGVRDAARGAENLMPRILQAVKSRATLGEIAETLRKQFGTYQPKTTL